MDYTFHPGVNGSKPWVEFFPYNPSLTAGYAFTAVFGIATVVHIVLMFPYHAAYFIPLVIGGICETFGYYGRARAHNDQTGIGPWAQQQMLILCAPPFVAATIYMVLGRIIRVLDAEHLSSVRTKRLTVIFVLNDVICFLTQLIGSGVQVTGSANVMAIGKKAVLAGLIFSLVVFCLFVWIAIAFHMRLLRDPTMIVVQNPRLNWTRYMWALYASCLALAIRNLMRTIQFGANKESALNTKEVYIYVFDAAFMMVSMAVLIVWHPGLLIKKARKAGQVEKMYGAMSQEGPDSMNIPLVAH